MQDSAVRLAVPEVRAKVPNKSRTAPGYVNLSGDKKDDDYKARLTLRRVAISSLPLGPPHFCVRMFAATLGDPRLSLTVASESKTLANGDADADDDASDDNSDHAANIYLRLLWHW